MTRWLGGGGDSNGDSDSDSGRDDGGVVVEVRVTMVGSWDGARLTVMFLNFATPVCLLLLLPLAASEDVGFTFNDFRSSNLTLDGVAEFTHNGLLALTNGTKQQKGHAFFPNPITFKTSPNSPSLSFSTTFVFSIISQYPNLSGHGIVFIVSPTRALPEALPSQYLGLFNKTNNDNASNHFVAVELDTIYNSEFNDKNENHVGIDINSLVSKYQSERAIMMIKMGSFIT
ncbi:hypothetical protein HYC85_006596 [Camellia sinensis]|uniref:Legume lectin domain-containing protein n=1 Tax=Camellia sinensis TaxID=4442 RepID=A0A7J7HLI6_CAMSI|nr:hypothetical protein HYC85_006596 [Camellia sinensis]